MKELTFKLQTKARPVNIVGENDAIESFELREMRASARDKYMDQLSSRLLVDDKGNIIGIKKYDGMQTELLTKCLYDSEGKPVTKEKLEAWPASCVAALFAAAQQINSMQKSDDNGGEAT